MSRNFDGVNDDINFDNANMADQGDGTTIAVIRRTAAVAFSSILVNNTTTSNGWRCDDFGVNDFLSFSKQAGTDAESTLALTQNDWYIVGWRVDVSTNIIFYRMLMSDPTSLATDTVADTSTIFAVGSGAHGYIGSRGVDDVTVFDGDIARVLHWDTLVADADIQKIIRSYLRNAYSYNFANLRLDYHLVGSSPEQSFAGGRRDGTVSGPTVSDHAPLPAFFGFDRVAPVVAAALPLPLPLGSLALTGVGR